jgi:hypothetical protein
MRHLVLSGAIATGPRRVVHPTAAAGLVAPPGRALGVAPRRLCTVLCAVNLAAITVAADQHLSLAAHAQKQPGRRRRRGQQRTWTRSAMTGILPRHACSARCGARRRSETWPLRSAPCRPRHSGRFLPRAKQAAQGRNPPTRASLWICGQHKNVAHKPTGPTAAEDNLNDLEIRSVRTTPGRPQRQPSGRPVRALPPSLRGFRQPFTTPSRRIHFDAIHRNLCRRFQIWFFDGLPEDSANCSQ